MIPIPLGSEAPTRTPMISSGSSSPKDMTSVQQLVEAVRLINNRPRKMSQLAVGSRSLHGRSVALSLTIRLSNKQRDANSSSSFLIDLLKAGWEILCSRAAFVNVFACSRQ